MPRLLARLIPAIALASVVYTIYLLIKYITSSSGMTKIDRTRLVFAAIIAAVSLVLIFSVTLTSG